VSCSRRNAATSAPEIRVSVTPRTSVTASSFPEGVPSHCGPHNDPVQRALLDDRFLNILVFVYAFSEERKQNRVVEESAVPLGFSSSNASNAYRPLYSVALHRVDEDPRGFREQRRPTYRFYSNSVDRGLLATDCLLNCGFMERIAFDNSNSAFPRFQLFWIADQCRQLLAMGQFQAGEYAGRRFPSRLGPKPSLHILIWSR
jgi:hypothetical protein